MTGFETYLVLGFGVAIGWIARWIYKSWRDRPRDPVTEFRRRSNEDQRTALVEELRRRSETVGADLAQRRYRGRKL